MMGPKKIKETRHELREAFAKAGIDVAWLEREIENVPKENQCDLETLTLFRDALAKLRKKSRKGKP